MYLFLSYKAFIKRIFFPAALLLFAAAVLCACGNAVGSLPLPVPSGSEIIEEPVETPAPAPPIEIDGVLFSAETPRLVLTGLDVDETALGEILPKFEKLTFLDMQLFEDNIINLLDVGEQYILKNIHWAGEITNFDRDDIPEIPVAVIREVLANSFAHSIYNGTTYHEICIYPSKVTIYSPGTYASSHKPEEYIKKNLQSSIRNEKIAKLLFLSKSIEQFGSGFKRINSLCKDAKIKFSYEFDESGFTFIIHRKKTTEPANKAGVVTVNVTESVTLNKMERLVYQLLSINPGYTRDELADKTSKTVRTVQRTLNSLRNKGYIERIGSDKTGSWKILK